MLLNNKTDMRFFPKEIDFFEIFDRAALNVTKAATLLVSLMENFDNVDARAKEIYEVEQDGDMLTHDIMKKLNKTFITPIDREDLHALASSLDDVLDLIWASVDRLAVFKITEPTKEAVAMSKDLLTTAEVIHKAIKKLKEKDYSYVQEYCIEINRLENRIDRDFRDALGALFNDVKDPILIIKWKEIYEHLEDASDKCEDVANVLESIVLKYA
jgi:predicted phosphate transport protein (TIGR00153 family)